MCYGSYIYFGSCVSSWVSVFDKRKSLPAFGMCHSGLLKFCKEKCAVCFVVDLCAVRVLTILNLLEYYQSSTSVKSGRQTVPVPSLGHAVFLLQSCSLSESYLLFWLVGSANAEFRNGNCSIFSPTL
jgi:hypothetical protein